MRIDIHCYETDSGTNIEIANALIENILGNSMNEDARRYDMKRLAEIVEHIQVFLKYNKEGM